VLKSYLIKPLRTGGRLRRDESGAVSVEFAIWMPVLFSVGLLVADASAAFTTQASMWRTAGELARGLATGRINRNEAQAYIAGTPLTLNDPIPLSGGVVTVELSRSHSGIGTGFLLSPLGTMRVQVRQIVEPHVNNLN